VATKKVQTVPEIQQESSGEKRGDKGEIYRIPPINLNTVIDKELIEAMDELLIASPFKSHSDLIRHIVRVMIPAFKNHPAFSREAAIESITQALTSTSNSSPGFTVTTKNTSGVEW
jgi:hypothetical protein